jgi:hypothetical protein
VAEAATAVLNRERFGVEPLDGEDLEALFAMLRRVRLAADDFVEAAR